MRNENTRLKMKDNLNILLLGSGGRECTLAWKLAQSPHTQQLFIAPGNAGTAQFGENLSINPADFDDVAAAAIARKVDMLVVGNEDPLVAGIADRFHSDPSLRHIAVVGPEAAGARLEGSKDFAKEFMLRHGIPTARHLSVTNDTVAQGYDFLNSLKPPYVLKADGLAAGKGVLIVDELEQAKTELENMLGGKFGEAGRTVVIEEFLSGIECSAFVVTDGNDYRLLPIAKDYKRVGEGDTGLNTGGMGSVSPVPFADKPFVDKIRSRIIEPTLAGLRDEGIPYCGFIFFGLMNVGGDPMVIEYNVRMGDPETESVMPRLKTDLVKLLHAAATGTLADVQVDIDPRHAATVMMVSGGYPGRYEKGKTITGLDRVEHSTVFHAGTKTLPDGSVVTAGGRVLAVTALADTQDEALAMAYDDVARISFDAANYRRDIGQDLK